VDLSPALVEILGQFFDSATGGLYYVESTAV
jgi:hypothetical protein